MATICRICRSHIVVQEILHLISITLVSTFCLFNFFFSIRKNVENAGNVVNVCQSVVNIDLLEPDKMSDGLWLAIENWTFLLAKWNWIYLKAALSRAQPDFSFLKSSLLQQSMSHEKGSIFHKSKVIHVAKVCGTKECVCVFSCYLFLYSSWI